MIDGILTVNAGSSSIKVALFERGAALSAPVFAGQVEGIGVGALTHEEALAQLVARVREAAGDMKRVTAVGHRIVHGGTTFERPALIDESVGLDVSVVLPWTDPDVAVICATPEPTAVARPDAFTVATDGASLVHCAPEAFGSNTSRMFRFPELYPPNTYSFPLIAADAAPLRAVGADGPLVHALVAGS